MILNMSLKQMTIKKDTPTMRKKLKEKNTIVCLQVLKAQMVKNGYGKKRKAIKPNYF